MCESHIFKINIDFWLCHPKNNCFDAISASAAQFPLPDCGFRIRYGILISVHPILLENNHQLIFCRKRDWLLQTLWSAHGGGNPNHLEVALGDWTHAWTLWQHPLCGTGQLQFCETVESWALPPNQSWLKALRKNGLQEAVACSVLVRQVWEGPNAVQA